MDSTSLNELATIPRFPIKRAVSSFSAATRILTSLPLSSSITRIKIELGSSTIGSSMKEMTETLDYKNTGGAMLLGINGNVVKAHGSSDQGFSLYL